MCLAIPGQIKEIKGQQVEIQYPGEVRKALLGGENVKVGDYVLVQMGIVIKTITPEEAKVSLKAWEGK
jgi:hydrogenase assembly chaperone HypC/HupF